MTVFRAATLRTFFFAFHAGAKELKAFSGDLRKVRSVKETLQQLRCIDNAATDSSFKHFEVSKHTFLAFFLHASTCYRCHNAAWHDKRSLL